MIILFVLLRIMDVHSSWLVINRYGAGVEGMSVSRYLINLMGYWSFALLNFVVSVGGLLIIRHVFKPLRNGITGFFIAINAAVVASNYIFYFISLNI